MKTATLPPSRKTAPARANGNGKAQKLPVKIRQTKMLIDEARVDSASGKTFPDDEPGHR